MFKISNMTTVFSLKGLFSDKGRPWDKLKGRLKLYCVSHMHIYNIFFRILNVLKCLQKKNALLQRNRFQSTKNVKKMQDESKDKKTSRKLRKETRFIKTIPYKICT